MKRHILTGIRCGLRAWLVYGVVEFMLVYAIPMWWFHPSAELLIWQWRPIALTFGVYLLFGIVLGAVSGVVIAWTAQHINSGFARLHETAAALTLSVALMANLIPAWPLTSSEYIALIIAVVLAASFLAALVSSPWRDRAAFLANPWAVSVLFLVIPWVNHGPLADHSRILKAGVSLLLFGLVLLLAVLWQRLRSGHTDTLRRQEVVAAVTATLLLLSAVILSRKPSTVRANQETRSAQPGKPNVILITMDTVRADHLSVYGYERDTTPQLRDFAREATVYSRAVATSDWTLPSHASIFTGLYPSWHGAYYSPPDYPWGRPLGSRYTTLAEVLRAHGYSTAGIVANYGNLQPSLGLARGFAFYVAHEPVRLSMPADSYYLREGARRVLGLAVDTAVFDAVALRAADINQRAFALLEQAPWGGPFFLFS